MTIYTIMHNGDRIEAYNKKQFEKNIWSPFCQNAIKEIGYVTILKENKKSQRYGRIIPHPDNDGTVEVQWFQLERMEDGGY